MDLASVTDPAELPQVVAAASDLREAASLNPLQALVNELNDQHILLIIDNCEHLAAACQRLVKVLIPTCPRVVILLTSRTPLHVPTRRSSPYPRCKRSYLNTDASAMILCGVRRYGYS